MTEMFCLSKSCTKPNEALVSIGQQWFISIMSKSNVKEDGLHFELEQQLSENPNLS